MFDFVSMENFNFLLKFVSENFFPLLGLLIISGLVFRIFIFPILKFVGKAFSNFWNFIFSSDDNHKRYYRRFN